MALRIAHSTRLLASDSDDGFTLIESLCAFFIVSLTLVTASEALQMAIRANSRSDTSLEALMIAKEKLESFADGAPIEYRQADGTTPDKRYTWRVIETPIMASGRAISAYLVSQVYQTAPANRPKQMIVELKTFSRH